MPEKHSKFFIINTCALWNEGTIDDALKVNETSSSLCLNKKVFYNYADEITLDVTVIDFEMDGCGNLYILTKESAKIVVFDQVNNTYKEVGCIHCSGAEKIAVSDLDIFILKENSITCFARVNYQKRWKRDVKDVEKVIDISATNEGTIYVLTEAGAGTSKEIIQLERKYNEDDLLSETIETFETTNIDPISITVSGQFVYIIHSDENDEYCKLLTIDLSDKTKATTVDDLPMKKDFRPEIMAVDHKGEIYLSTGNTKEIIIIELMELFDRHGNYITKIFDSGIQGCRWHKVILDMGLPKNTRVELSYTSSDDQYTLKELRADPSLWADNRLTNPKDALLPKAIGQFVRLKIQLFSDDIRKSSPEINSIKLEFPHHSYLRYLPAVFQENETGKEFLERFLPLFETFFSNYEEAISSSTKYLDADATTDEFLPWLKQWLGLSYDENWHAEKVRKLINMAPYLYKLRGTRTGIEEIIKLYLENEDTTQKIKQIYEICNTNDSVKQYFEILLESMKFPVIIIEGFHAKRCIKEEKHSYSLSELGICKETNNAYLKMDTLEGLREEDIIKIKGSSIEKYAIISKISKKEEDKIAILRGEIKAAPQTVSVSKVSVIELLGGTNPYGFSIIIRPFALSAQQLRTIRRIVDMEKPAHTVGYVKELEPWFYLDGHTYLGINTILSKPAYVLGKSLISRDAVLLEREWSGQMDVSSIINENTKLT
jgi:phage tail-like protein